MTDSNLRELERLCRATGAKIDEQAFDAARVRAGELFETAFIQRSERGNSIRVYRSKEDVEEFSLSPLLPKGYRVSDMDYLETGLGIIAHMYRGFNVHTRVYSILADGSVAHSTGKGCELQRPQLVRFISCRGAFALLFRGSDLGQEPRRYVIDASHCLKREPIETNYAVLDILPGAIIGHDSHGYVVVPVGSDAKSTRLSGMASVYVENEGFSFREEALLPDVGSDGYLDLSGLVPSESRFATGKFYAKDRAHLARLHRGDTRVLREIPAKTLDGLLVALDRASHKKQRKR